MLRELPQTLKMVSSGVISGDRAGHSVALCRPINLKLRLKLPKSALFDYEQYPDVLKLPHFLGVFMKDTLRRKSKSEETGIVILDSYGNPNLIEKDRLCSRLL